jgi:hypothetical protein
MSETYSCPECGGDRDALLTPIPLSPAMSSTPPRVGSPCTCTQNSRTSGAFGERLAAGTHSGAEVAAAPAPRLARLRPEYADWYPSIIIRTWQEASLVAEAVQRQLATGSPAWVPGSRVLSDAHFEFQGGETGRRPGERRAFLAPDPGAPH